MRNRKIPRIHYVAPQLWAWRPWRVYKFKRHFHHLLALLPFEPAWFARYGLDCRFVGHPVVEGGFGEPGDGLAFRIEHGIDPEAPVICVLLGSRAGEVSRLAAPFRDTVARLHANHPDLVAIVPTVPNVSDTVRGLVADWPLRTIVSEDAEEKFSAMSACDIALAASGTVTLELAMAGAPFIVAYRTAPITYLLGRLLVRVRYVNLINLILDREIAPEFLQGRCRPELMAAALLRLLDGGGAAQAAAMRPALEQLGIGGAPPSRRAADAVLDIIGGAQEIQRI